MIGVEADLEINLSPEDVMQAEKDRRMDAATLGYSVSQERVPFDTGKLKESAFPPEKRDGDVVFGYTRPYAEDMEEGTEPKHVPIKPLIRWAERIGKDTGFAYVVQDKIAEEGITPQPYLKPAADRMAPWLDNHSLEEYLE